MNDSRRLAGILVAVLVPVVVWAGNLVLPFSFQAGSPIRASEMNANFAAVKQAVDDLDARVSGTGAGLLRSGSRLKMLTLEGPDGLSSPVAGQFSSGFFWLLWDSQLQTVCAAGLYSVAQDRCLPISSASPAYLESTCQTEVGAFPSSGIVVDSFVGDAGVKQYLTSSMADGGLVIRELGAQSAAAASVFNRNQYTTGLPDGGSVTVDECVAGGSYRTAPIIGTVPVSMLAPISLHVR